MVRKYCVLYFAILILIVIVIAAPAIAAGYVPDDIGDTLTNASSITKGLFQPRKTDNNDTKDPSRSYASHWSFASYTPTSTEPYTSKA